MGKLLIVVAMLGACATPKTEMRAVDDEVAGRIAPTDPTFLKDDPAGNISCKGDTDCPTGALCHPGRHMCFTSYPAPRMLSVEPGTPSTQPPIACQLVPLYFATDSDQLIAEAQQWVDHNARCVQQRGGSKVVVIGHADASGEEIYNVQLSEKRAIAVKSLLEQKGVGTQIETRGKGETDPVMKGSTEKDFAYNRRVELQVQ